jgi:uncharacterized protein YndB with AHSA1/START domain
MGGRSESNEIRLIRLYDAPVNAVWEAWTDPAQVGEWWGPRGFTITTHQRSLRQGGTWDYTMHGPDGTDWPNHAYYHEVVPKEKLVYDQGARPDAPPMFRVTVLFSEAGGKTRLEMTMTFPTPAAAESTRGFIKKMSGESTWDRLSEFMAKRLQGKEKFEINRSFDAPIGTMFEMWTNPEHVARWTPPTGSTMKWISIDLRPGGGGFYSMTDGKVTMYGRTAYREIRKPDRIVYTQQFCDEDGRVSRHPFAPTWPETMLTTVTLADEGPGRTRVTITWEPYGTVTPAELEIFVNARGGMTMGWTGSLDKLETHLLQ